MKKIVIILLAIFGLFQCVYSQDSITYCKDLPVLYIGKDVSLHILSPENIQFVDISTNRLIGDLPLKNILRLKIVPDSLRSSSIELGIVTIVGESFIAQYNLRLATPANQLAMRAQVDILPEHTKPLDVPDIKMTQLQMRNYSFNMLRQHDKSAIRSADAYRLKVKLNHIYTVGDNIFLDITYFNDTNLAYDIDELRFKIEDKKILKATNNQSIEVKPLWQLYTVTSFKKSFHNIYVLKKLTFPENKLLNIELTEKQISGRTLKLSIKYSDILKADTF